jgi:hypothetical protein
MNGFSPADEDLDRNAKKLIIWGHDTISCCLRLRGEETGLPLRVVHRAPAGHVRALELCREFWAQAAGSFPDGANPARIAIPYSALVFDWCTRHRDRRTASRSMKRMELPTTVSCDICDAESHVPHQSIDEDATAGQIPGFDQRWGAGFWYTLLCPSCGRRKQQLGAMVQARPR